MSDDDFDFEDESQEFESEGIKNLRKQAKALAKQNSDLQRQLTEALAAQRRGTVNDVLKGLGANPKISKYIPSDVEPTEDALKAWLADEGELFGYKAPETKPEGQDQGQAENGAQQAAQGQQWAGQQLPPELVAAFNRVQNPESFGGVQTQGSDAQALAQMKSLADQAKGNFYDFEELHRKLNT